jgi:hypothetical protein
MHRLKLAVPSGTAEWGAYSPSSRLCTAIGPLGELTSETKFLLSRSVWFWCLVWRVLLYGKSPEPGVEDTKDLSRPPPQQGSGF